MNLIAFVAIGSYLVAASLAESDSKDNGRQEQSAWGVSTSEIDLGEMDASEGGSATVNITNYEDKNLQIEKVASFCHCVSATVEKTLLKPGESVPLEIKTHLEGYTRNEVRGTICVMTDDPTTPNALIKVKGQIKSDYVIEPSEVDFGTVKLGQSATKLVTIQQQGPTLLKVLGVTAPDTLHVELIDKDRTVKPSKVTANAPVEYLFNVQLAPTSTKGKLRSNFKIKTNSARMPTVEVPVQVNVVGVEYALSRQSIVFFSAKPGDTVGELTLSGSTDLHIIDATCDHADLSVSVEPLPDKKAFRIVVRLNSSATPGRKDGQVKLYLGEGSIEEYVILRIAGTVTE